MIQEVSELMSDYCPKGAKIASVRHRVPFYETDGMGIVHHSNHVRYFELARIEWMDVHHRPYRDYVAENLHFATTKVEVQYLHPIPFDAEITISAYLVEARGASILISYFIHLNGEVLATGSTEHVLVDNTGRPRRIPRIHRRQLEELLPSADSTEQ